MYFLTHSVLDYSADFLARFSAFLGGATLTFAGRSATATVRWPS